MTVRSTVLAAVATGLLVVSTLPMGGCGAIVTAATMSGKLPDAATVLEAAVRAGRSLSDPAAELRTIGPNQGVTGTLDEDDHQLDDGTYFDTWFYTGSAGERVQIDLWSDDFEPFLVLGFMEVGLQGTFEQLAAAGGPDLPQPASIVITLDRSGTYAILANTVEPGQLGAYRMRVMHPGAEGEVTVDSRESEGEL